MSCRSNLCINIGSKLKKALHHILQSPVACQVEGSLSISGFFISLPIRARPPGAVHVTTTARTRTHTHEIGVIEIHTNSKDRSPV